MAEPQRNSGGMDPWFQFMGSWVGGFAQGLSACILWVSRDGPTTSSLTQPQHCHWHHAQTVLSSRLLSSSLLTSREISAAVCWWCPHSGSLHSFVLVPGVPGVPGRASLGWSTGHIWLSAESQQCLGHRSHLSLSRSCADGAAGSSARAGAAAIKPGQTGKWRACLCN